MYDAYMTYMDALKGIGTHATKPKTPNPKTFLPSEGPETVSKFAGTKQTPRKTDSWVVAV